MILIIILCCFLINGINNTLVKLEYRQEALCYDIYLLQKEIKKDERILLNEY